MLSWNDKNVKQQQQKKTGKLVIKYNSHFLWRNDENKKVLVSSVESAKPTVYNDVFCVNSELL